MSGLAVGQKINTESSMDRKPLGALLLALMASLGISLLRFSGTSDPVWLMIEVGLMSLLSLGLAFGLMERLTASSGVRTYWVVGLGVLMVSVPWISRWILMEYFGSSGEANELVALAMLQYGGLLQASLARTGRGEWMSFLISCFLMIFGLSSSDRTGMLQLVIPFTLLASWWLMAKYWERIEEGFLVSQSVSVIPVRVSVIGLFALTIVATSLLGWWNRDAANRLEGFMPTSGGNKQAESWGRQGVGDGDMLIAAQDEAYTFGPVDSALFLESQAPSMYDLATDVYGEAAPKNKKYARAISLEDAVQEMEKEGTESKKNSKEFSAVRRPKGDLSSFKPKGNDSRAVAYVIGEVPQWLRIESFDRFEENVWSHSFEDRGQGSSKQPTMVMLRDKPWMQVQYPAKELVFAVRERIAVKLINLKSPRLLTPSLVTHVHIDKIDQEDFFSWMGDGQLMMPNRDYVPSMTVVHQLIQVPQLHALRVSGSGYSSIAHGKQAHSGESQGNQSQGRVQAGGRSDWLGRYLQLPTRVQGDSQLVTDFLRDIQDGVTTDATDWQRVEEIVRRLREMEYDPRALVEESSSDAVDFVLTQRRGTDYLLASAAVVLIRQLGIPARLATGFFVSPNRYDRKSGQTEVLPEDLHTWGEVYVHGMWIPIEPTGAYPIPREHRSWQQYAIEMLWACRDFIRLHPFRVALGVLGVVGAIWVRRRIATMVLSVLCSLLLLVPRRFAWEEWRLRCCLGYLRWRMWLMGETIDESKTMSQWLREQVHGVGDGTVDAFIRLVQRCAYGPEGERRVGPEGGVLVREVFRSEIAVSLRRALMP